jgi:hypothetical protein
MTRKSPSRRSTRALMFAYRVENSITKEIAADFPDTDRDRELAHKLCEALRRNTAADNPQPGGWQVTELRRGL